MHCQCSLCGFLTKSKKSKEEHEITCLARHLSLSFYYAEPLNTEMFSSKYLEDRKKENVNDHLVSQINLLSEALRLGDFPNAEKTVSSIDQMAKVQKLTFSRVLEEETEMDLKFSSNDMTSAQSMSTSGGEASAPQDSNLPKKQSTVTRYLLKSQLSPQKVSKNNAEKNRAKEKEKKKGEEKAEKGDKEEEEEEEEGEEEEEEEEERKMKKEGWGRGGRR